MILNSASLLNKACPKYFVNPVSCYYQVVIVLELAIDTISDAPVSVLVYSQSSLSIVKSKK